MTFYMMKNIQYKEKANLISLEERIELIEVGLQWEKQINNNEIIVISGMLFPWQDSCICLISNDLFSWKLFFKTNGKRIKIDD